MNMKEMMKKNYLKPELLVNSIQIDALMSATSGITAKDGDSFSNDFSSQDDENTSSNGLWNDEN